MKETIGIIYICTGPYYLFWKKFYETFEENFLPNVQKKYFVFTDSKNIDYENEDNVNKFYLEAKPWPLITLLRYDTFIKIEDLLKSCDYTMFSNANIVCNEKIQEEEFLPRKEKGEKIFVTIHPGYFEKKKICFPYERNKKSTAYIPYNCGNNYVIGAMFGGITEDFLNMSKILKKNIEEDLKNNYIAKWHDESHLNNYIINKSFIRVLSPEYCYPFGMKVKYNKKISAVSKEEKFDVKQFKGQYFKKEKMISKIYKKLKNKIFLKEKILFLVDVILHKKVGN